MGYSGVIQLSEVRALLKEKSLVNFHTELMKQENTILEGLEFQEIVCGVITKLESNGEVELDKYYTEFDDASSEFEVSLHFSFLTDSLDVIVSI